MRKWFIKRFLPSWALRLLREDLHSLEKENALLREKIRQLHCYNRGLLRGWRAAKRQAQKEVKHEYIQL